MIFVIKYVSSRAANQTSSMCLNPHQNCVISPGETADLFYFFNVLFITFPYGVLGHVWYLIVSIPDLCLLVYFCCSTLFKVSKMAKIRKRYNQVPHLTQDTTWESRPQLYLIIKISKIYHMDSPVSSS